MSIEYGVTATGFNVKRLEDIKSELEADLRALFGDINTGPDSVFGQHIGAFSKPLAEVWEKMAGVYDSHYPASAEGIALDNVVTLNGLERLGPTSTVIQAIIEGAQSTVVPTGTQFSTDDGDLFETIEDATLDVANVVKSLVTIESGSAPDYDGSTFTVTLNGETFPKVAGSGDDELSIAEALKTLINASSLPLTASVPTTPDGTITIIGSLDAEGNPTPFSIAVSESGPSTKTIEISEQWTPVICRSVERGAILCITNTLTEIETPVAGMDAVDNLVDGTIGRGAETDAELRLRRRGSLQVVGAATVEAIRARLLQEVEGVSSVIVFENREDTAVDGRPGHSFEAVVQGGIPQEIGEKIWEVKPAGIQTTYGNAPLGSQVEVDVTDSMGNLQTIQFSRPTPKYAWVKVLLTLYDATEEQFPVDGVAQIAANILELGESLQIGRDLTIQRWFGPVYEVAGVASATITHALEDDPGDTPSYSGGNIVVDSTWLPLFTASRISVSIP